MSRAKQYAAVLATVALGVSTLLVGPVGAQVEKIPVDDPPGGGESPPVQVLVSKYSGGGQVVYRYRVVNGSAFPITTLQVGFDYAHQQPELGMFASDPIPTGATSPAGWAFGIEPTEEAAVGNLIWDVDTLETGILGGATLGGFSVPLAQADSMYEKGHWTAYVVADDELYFTGKLEPDATASVPLASMYAASTLRVSPNPARGLVTFDFEVPLPGLVTVNVFDAAGRSIREVVRRVMPAGKGSAAWDGHDREGGLVAPGTYFVRVKAGKTQRFARMTWLR